MARWVYRTKFGTFWIRQERDGRYALGMDDELLGHYSSAIAAADDVFTGHSGHHGWDAQTRIDQPTDLSEWEKRP